MGFLECGDMSFDMLVVIITNKRSISWLNIVVSNCCQQLLYSFHSLFVPKVGLNFKCKRRREWVEQPLINLYRSPIFYTHGCQPGNNLQRFFGSLASRIKWFTCPLTLSNVPSSSPSSFCLSLTRTLSAILFTDVSSRFPLVPPSLPVSRTCVLDAATSDVSMSAFLCNDIACNGLKVHTYRGS